jgi:hypothetical protein
MLVRFSRSYWNLWYGLSILSRHFHHLFSTELVLQFTCVNAQRNFSCFEMILESNYMMKRVESRVKIVRWKMQCLVKTNSTILGLVLPGWDIWPGKEGPASGASYS